METLLPGQMAQFMRKFAFRGGRLAGWRIRTKKGISSALLILVVKTPGGERVRMKMAFEDVTEYRFQRRPHVRPRPFEEVRLGYFDGVFYFNLDAFADDAPPQVIDFRNSEAFVAGAKITWKIL